MSEYSRYLNQLYRRNILMERGAEDRKGLISKLNRKIRNYEKNH